MSGEFVIRNRNRASDSRSSRSSRSRSLMSRTEPFAPANRPSASSVPNALNSAGIGCPSRWSRLSRPRSSWNSAVMLAVQSTSATSRDVSWTSAPKCLPRRSSGFQPVSRSQVSETNVNRASASIDQTRSGEFWTRCR